MALGSTVYNFEIALSDTTREVYETLTLRAARHSSETLEFTLCRVLAFCIEYVPEMEFTKGLDDPEMPAIWARDLTGQITHWVEIGAPSPEKLHKASKQAARVAVYCHKNPAITLQFLTGQKIHRAEEISVSSFAPQFIERLAELTERRNVWEVTISDGALYLRVAGASIETTITLDSIPQ